MVPTLECNLLWVRAIVGGLIKGAAGSQKFLWFRVLSLVVDSYKKNKEVIGDDQGRSQKRQNCETDIITVHIGYCEYFGT